MRCYISNKVVLSRVPDGPLARYIRPFAESQSVQGYARSSIYRQVCSLQDSVIGYNNRESLYVMSAPITSRGFCVIALDGCGLTRMMPQYSGTS